MAILAEFTNAEDFLVGYFVFNKEVSFVEVSVQCEGSTSFAVIVFVQDSVFCLVGNRTLFGLEFNLSFSFDGESVGLFLDSISYTE